MFDTQFIVLEITVKLYTGKGKTLQDYLQNTINACLCYIWSKKYLKKY